VGVAVGFVVGSRVGGLVGKNVGCLVGFIVCEVRTDDDGGGVAMMGKDVEDAVG
jgi:hypothetical protein